jgi:hypothetical protein
MTTNRVSLPENFYDKTSDQLLCQPEPQYPFAALFLSAIAASLPIPAGLGLDGRQVVGQGTPYATADRDRLMLAQQLPVSLFAVGLDFAKQPGDTVRINRPAFANTTYTKASRAIARGQSISTTPITIGSEQTHLQLERFAGPYDQTNSRVAPLAVEGFDANMGVFSETSMVAMQLMRDFHRFIDAIHVTLGDSGTVLYPDGMAADNEASTADSFPMTLEQVSRTEQDMDDASLPTLPDGSRVLMLSPKQWKQLKHDPEYKAQADYHKEFNLLFPNYVGSVGKFHIFKSVTLSRPNNSSTVPVHRGIAIAPGAFMGGMGRKPRAASSTDDNFGETGKVVWIADLAFGIADSRFFRSVRSA